MVEVGSAAFFENCLQSMAYGPALGVLGSAETLNAQPAWLEAAIDAGLFRLDDRRSNGERDVFVVGEQRAIAKILRAITEMRVPDGATLPSITHDPITQQVLGEGMQPDQPLQIGLDFRKAYSKLVTHVLEQVPASHAPVFSRDRKTTRTVPVDGTTLNLGMLLTGAVYLGDIESGKQLMDRCPAAALVPVCGLRRSVLHPIPLITPIGAALLENRAEFLDLFRQHDLDILRSPAFFTHNDAKVRLLDPTPAKVLEAASSIVSRLSGTSGIDDIWPSTLAVVLEEARDHTQRGEMKESSLANQIVQCVRNFDPSQMAVLLRSDAIAQCADCLVEELIETLVDHWKGAATVHRELTQQVIDQLLDSINFDKHLGDQFPPNRAFNDGLGSLELALELAHQYASRSRQDLLIERHNVGMTNESDASFVHTWAGQGATELVLYGLELGANPQEKDRTGRTMVEYAEQQGMEATAAAIRAHAARAEAQAAIASIGREFLSGP